MKTTTPILLIALLLTLGNTAPAQYFDQAGEVVVSNTLSAGSLQPAGDHVFVSMVNSGRQITVDVEDPTNPTVVGGIFDPSYGDQFTDGVYADVFGGRLFTAHRFGGINMLDTSNPLALATDDTIAPGSTTSNYSHEGLKVWQSDCFSSPVGPLPFLFYSECHTSATGPSSMGGIRIFAVGPGNLTEISTSLGSERGGMALDVTRDGQLCLQLCYQDLNQSSQDQRLVVYDVSNPWSPSVLGNVTMGATAGYTYTDADLEVDDDSEFAYAAVGYDGLKTIDVTTPTAPVVNTYIANPILFIRGLTFYRKNVLLVSGRIDGSTPLHFFASLNVGASPAAPPVMSVHFTNMAIQDMKVENGMVYLLGTRTNGDRVLQTWM